VYVHEFGSLIVTFLFFSEILARKLKKENSNDRINGHRILIVEIFIEENPSEILSYVHEIIAIDFRVKTTYINN